MRQLDGAFAEERGSDGAHDAHCERRARAEGPARPARGRRARDGDSARRRGNRCGRGRRDQHRARCSTSWPRPRRPPVRGVRTRVPCPPGAARGRPCHRRSRRDTRRPIARRTRGTRARGARATDPAAARASRRTSAASGQSAAPSRLVTTSSASARATAGTAVSASARTRRTSRRRPMPRRDPTTGARLEKGSRGQRSANWRTCAA